MVDPGSVSVITGLIVAVTALLAELRRWRKRGRLHVPVGLYDAAMRLRTAACALVLSALPAAADAPNTYTGKVLPFEIIAAIRNYGITKGGILPAQVAISVEGGTQADWLATAVYVAEKSIVDDVTFAEVEVYAPSPWGDKPPQSGKQLAKAYYAGPDPKRSPWPDEPWLITAQGHAPALPDIEFAALADKLLGEEPPSDDPDKASDAADVQATRLLIKKYRLPKTWKPDEHLGAMDPKAVQVNRRDQVVVSDSDDAEASIEQLRECLIKDDGQMFKGCQDRSEDYRFKP